MREWLETLASFVLLATGVCVGVIAAHAILYVFSLLFWLVVGR